MTSAAGKAGRWGALVLLLVCWHASCTLAPYPSVDRETALRALATEAYPRFSTDMDPASLAQALRRSLDYYAKVPPGTTFWFGADGYSDNASSAVALARKLFEAHSV